MLTKVGYAEQIPRKLSRDNEILWCASYEREPRGIERSRQHSYRLQKRSAIKETVSRHTTGKPVSGKFVRVTALAVELSKPSLFVDLSKTPDGHLRRTFLFGVSHFCPSSSFGVDVK